MLWGLGIFVVLTLGTVIYQLATGDNTSSWTKLVFVGGWLLFAGTTIPLFVFDWRELNREYKANMREFDRP